MYSAPTSFSCTSADRSTGETRAAEARRTCGCCELGCGAVVALVVDVAPCAGWLALVSDRTAAAAGAAVAWAGFFGGALRLCATGGPLGMTVDAIGTGAV